MKSIKLPYAELWYENSLLRIEYAGHTKVDREMMKALIVKIEELVKEESFCSLNILNVGSDISRGARDYLEKYFEVDIRASALVSNNMVVRVIANFILLLSPPKYPLRLFYSSAEAMDWIDPILHDCRERNKARVEEMS